METNGPRDLKVDLKYSVEYPLPDQRCSQKLFAQNRGLKGLHFSTKGQKSLTRTQQNVTQSLAK